MLRQKSNNEYYRLYGSKFRFCATIHGTGVPKILQDGLKAGLTDFAPQLMDLCPLKVPYSIGIAKNPTETTSGLRSEFLRFQLVNSFLLKQFQGHFELTNRTLEPIDISNFPITWEKTQFKYFVTVTTLKDEVALKVDIVFNGITVRKPYK
jgi:hypothetical protein